MQQPPEANLASAALDSQGDANVSAVGAGNQNTTSPDGGLVDKSGISMDDFIPRSIWGLQIYWLTSFLQFLLQARWKEAVCPLRAC